MRLLEQVLVRVDHGAGGALFRLVLGYATAAVWSYFLSGRAPSWTLYALFLAVLVALRLMPIALRGLLPFSRETQAAWADRRQIAKRYDSYQWQKLFWMGLGLAISAAQSGWQPRALTALTASCVLSGSVGLVIWRQRQRQLGA